MKPEQLIDNLNKPVTAFLNENFNEARATLKSWSRDFQTVYVRLNSQYGKKWKEGTLLGLPIGSVIPAKDKR